MKECVSAKTSLKEDEGALNTYKKPPESRVIGECFCVVPGHTSVFRTYGASGSLQKRLHMLPPEEETFII